MPIKKSDLYSSLWQSCDELRGGMDASQYKDYVLFIKYITDIRTARKWRPSADSAGARPISTVGQTFLRALIHIENSFYRYTRS